MTIHDFLPILLFLFVLTLSAVPLGEFIAKVFSGKRTFLTPIASPVEKLTLQVVWG